jgi:copper chaperone CopZ
MTDVMTFRVAGMRHAIEEEVGRVAGVTGVEVDLAAKLVTVRGDAPDEQALRAAIDEAGYDAE